MIVFDDLRFALRSYVRRPLLPIVVVLTLGLAIGVNSGIFSVINAALLSSLRVRAPEQLGNVYTTDTLGRGHGSTSYADYVYLRDHSRAFSGVIGYSGLMTTLTGRGEPQVVFGELVSGNYFNVTGARLALGRGFSADEDQTPGTHPVVVISHRLWLRRFAGDSAIVGQSITMNGHAFTVIGVAHQEFNGLMFRGLSADLWAPVMMMGQLRTDQRENRAERWMFVKGRLAQNATFEQASAELKTLGGQLALAYPETNRGRVAVVLPTLDVLVAPDGDRVVAPTAVIVLLIVSFVVLIASTNLANLMLARASARRREISVRLALGASRARLVSQLVVESAVLAILGGALGLAIAFGLAKAFVAFRPPLPVPIAFDVSVDWHVMAYTALAVIVACTLFGLIPALKASKLSVSAGMSAHDVAPKRRGRFLPGFVRKSVQVRNLFLIPQIALSLVLLVVAGLFIRSVSQAGTVDPGFNINSTALVALDLRQSGYDSARARIFYTELSRRMLSRPDVKAASVTSRIPLDLYGNQSATISVPAQATAGSAAPELTVQMANVESRYFDALGIRVIRGRVFTEAESQTGAGVAIVSEHTARELWPASEAVGQVIRQEGTDAVLQVIGVVADVKVQTLGEQAQLFVYRPFGNNYSSLLRVVARGTGNSAALVSAFRREVAAIDPSVPVFESKTMTEHLDIMLFPFRMAAQVSAALGAFGLLLVSVGLYGVVAFGVARRTREYGIRIALGARPADVRQLVMRGTFAVLGVGLAIGTVMSLATGKLLSSLLFGIGWSDPITLGGVAATFSIVALVACYVPARRATRVDPMVAMRDD